MGSRWGMEPLWRNVSRIEYGLRRGADRSRDALNVTYTCGTTRYTEQFQFGHRDGKHRAASWWRKHCNAPVPETSSEALRRTTELFSAARIQVQHTGKRMQIINYGLKANVR